MLNKATLIGNLGRDPEIRAMTNGNKVASLSLATTERWKDKMSGERKERTEWHRITIYNENVVRVVEQYTRKGSRIYVEGKISTRKYTDNAGVDKYSTEIVIENFNGNVVLLDSADRPAPGPDDYGTTRTREERPAAPASTGGRPSYDLDDDIPF